MVDINSIIEGTVKFRDGKKVTKSIFNQFLIFFRHFMDVGTTFSKYIHGKLSELCELWRVMAYNVIICNVGCE